MIYATTATTMPDFDTLAITVSKSGIAVAVVAPASEPSNSS